MKPFTHGVGSSRSWSASSATRALRAAALAAVVAVSLPACSGSGDSDSGGAAGGAESASASADFGTSGRDLGFKVGIMTGTVSQGEDEYRGAEAVIRRYGSKQIRHVTYPDNFMTEQEAMISQILNLAGDKNVKAIVVAQGVPGTMAAIKRVREFRPDVKFLVYEPHEDPHQIAEYADLCIMPDQLKRGETIVQLAHDMGAKTFVHYSFPRHMSQEMISRRAKIMEDKCTELGMEFVFANAPDPTGDQGLPGAQKFILEDVPREIETYGNDTAFFSTNCGMQEPLIRATVDNHAIMPEQCCPSPTHGYPGALGIAIADDDAGDMGKIREAIHAKIDAAGNSGRMGAWPVSVGMVAIDALTEHAIAVVSGTAQITDQATVQAELQKAADASVTVLPFEAKPNYYMFLIDSVIF
ncbi:MAG: DUF3798 domain-containing protein [Candidatus Eisenbacteria bacterium]